MTEPNRQQTPIAIIGVGALFPGATEVGGFWRNILAARDLITDVPPSHWLIDDYYDPNPGAVDKTYGKRGGFMPPVDFDPMAFGVPPNNIAATDTAQLLALIVAQQVLEDACQGDFASMKRERVSVVLGVASGTELLCAMANRMQRPVWLKGLRESGMPEDEAQAACDRIAANYTPWQEATFPGLLGNVVAGRIANRFDLHGTNCITDAACASSLSAIAISINELALGQSDLVITGGVDALNDVTMYMCFSKTPALSPTGDCRPFSDGADGTMLGEGLGMFALKRLADAERDGDRVYAVIRGMGTASDGRSTAVYAPLPEGQARAIVNAYQAAGYGPETVELLEAHGTGTKAGDLAEFKGLRSVFGDSARDDLQWCALGSVKSQIGHTKATSGAAGLLKAVLALHHKILPPTIKVERPNPNLDIETSPFYLNTQTRPWIRNDAHPRRAGVSSFGFGGSNFHMTVEEYRPTPGSNGKPAWSIRAMPTELVLLSAASATELLTRCRAMAGEAGLLADVARASQAGFGAAAPVRLAIVATDAANLGQQLAQAVKLITNDPQASFATPQGMVYSSAPAQAGKIGFLFSGQGSQYVGMGSDIAQHFSAARSAWDAAAALQFERQALHNVVFPIPVFSDAEREAQAALLTATEWAQPALAAQSLALLGILGELKLQPSAVGGHSFGELVALHAAGSFDAGVLLRLARKRGELMRDAGQAPGAMLAIACTRDEVEQHLARLQVQGVVIANHNTPTQVVVSGETAAIESLQAALEQAGLRVRRLQVATAFHSPIVAGASAPLRAFLQDEHIDSPRFDVFGNTSAAPYPAEADEIRAILAAQLSLPVRFVDQVNAMYDSGVRTFIEIGAGAALCDMVGQILGERPHLAITLDRKGKNGITSLQEAIGRLSVGGVALDFASWWENTMPAEARPVAKKPLMATRISGANFDKPYPPAGGAASLPLPNPPRPAPAVQPAAQPAAFDAAASGPAAASPVAAPVAVVSDAAVPVPAPVPAPAAIVAAPTFTASVPTMSPDSRNAWLAAFESSQRQTAEIHGVFQASMAESHMAFLKMAEQSSRNLASLAGGGGVGPVPRPAVAAPGVTPAPVAMSAPVAVATPVHAAPAPLAPSTPEPQAMAAPVPTQPAAPAVPGPDLETLMLSVVADKTGYPTEMLGMDMQLEADLGIDSIKRVEILSAMRELAPGLAEISPAELGKLRTLGEIVAHMRAQNRAAPAATISGNMAATAPTGPAAPAAPTPDLETLMLSVVADKTGYPTEMLGMDMQLEADLGIDSIKRVEILSAMRELAPGLAEISPAELGKLRTLGEIVAHMRSENRAGPAATTPGVIPAPTHAATPETTSGAAPADLEGLMLSVVADKTGYPTEMLSMDMQLEADLGIDSIKRVEILSAMRDLAPGLAEISPADMGKLRTLGEIVAHMRATGLPASVGAAPAAPTAVALPAVDSTAPAARALRFAVRLVPVAARGHAMPGLATRKLVVTEEGSGIAALVAAKLTAKGFAATVVDTVPADASGVIFLGGLRRFDDIEAALRINHEAFSAARSAAAHFEQSGGLFVTVQDTGGDFGLGGRAPQRAWCGGVAALVRTAAREWPLASLKAIDCERGSRDAATLAEAIVQELTCGGAELEVGLPEHAPRCTLVALPSPLQPEVDAPGRIDASSLLVVTGGARGVTAAALIALAKASQPQLVLIGRTERTEEPAELRAITDSANLRQHLIARMQSTGSTPAQINTELARLLAVREIDATLGALERAGSQARYLALDVQDPQALRAALAEVRQSWGPISGIVHGAGVLADRRIVDKSDVQFAHVFNTKVAGLRGLLEATAEDELSLICLFSSIAARTGNVGQSDYAMANEVLNQVGCAERVRRTGCLVRSIGWGPWQGGMVSASLAAHFEREGVALLSLAEGTQAFVDELAGKADEVQVLVLPSTAETGALGAPDAKGIRIDLALSAASHGYLFDHSIAGVPVVPVAMALEWLVRAARLWHPAPDQMTLKNVRVLRKIALDDFAGGGARRMHVQSNLRSASEHPGIGLDLCGDDDALHYRLVAWPGAVVSQQAASAAPSGLALLQRDALYDGHVLFHGPRFQAIAALEGIGAPGAVATLVGAGELGWPCESWQTDPALVDGGLQLAVLWAEPLLGGASLPMSVEEVRLHQPGLAPGRVRCVVRARQMHADRASCDITWYDADGTVRLELLKVELVLRPGQANRAAA